MLCGACATRFCSARLRCSRCGLGMDISRSALPEPVDGARSTGPVCLSCLREPPMWRAAVCAEDYAFPWNDLIGDFKFRSDVGLAALLAERLATALGQTPAAAEVDLLLPIPLSTQRLQHRGFNQAWELARRLGKRLCIPAEPQVLLRPVDTLHQAELSLQERARNLQSAFMVAPQARSAVAGQRVALVDDVMTTGSTFTEATRALLQAGARSVDVWAVARTP